MDVTSEVVSEVAVDEEQVLLERIRAKQSGEYDEAIRGANEPLILEVPEVDVTPDNGQPQAPAMEQPEHPEMGYGDYALDMGQGILTGVRNAVTEVEETAAELADWANEKAGGDPEYFQKLADEYQLPPLADASTGVGKFTQSTAQFLTGFIPAFKALRVIGGVKNSSKIVNAAKGLTGGATAGVITDFSVWEPMEERLSNHAKSFGDDLTAKAVDDYLANPNPDTLDAVEKNLKTFVGSVLSNQLTEFTQMNPEQGRLRNRVGQAVEGAVVGKTIEGFIAALRMFGKAKTVAIEEQMVASGVTPPKQSNIAYTINPATGERIVLDAVPTDQLPKFTLDVPLVRTDNFTDVERTEVFSSLLTGNYQRAGEVLKNVINIQAIKTTDDLDLMFNALDNLVEQSVIAAKRGKISLAETEAASLGLGENALEEGLARVRGLDSQVWKANVIDQAVAAQLRDVAAEAATRGTFDEQGVQDLIAKAFVVNQYVKGTASEMGRAFNVRRYFTKNGQLSTADIFNGVSKNNWSNTQDFLAAVHMLPNNQAVSNLVDGMKTQSVRRVLPEVLVNGILSPLALSTNLVSNAMQIFRHGAEISIAAAKSQSMGGSGEISLREPVAYATGLLEGVWNSLQVGFWSYVKDEPQFTKAWNEYSPKPAIVAETFGLSNQSPMGKAVDIMGKVIRGAPGATRSLMATDEIFKSLVYSAKVSQYAQREAMKKALVPGSPEFEAYVKEAKAKAYGSKPGDKFYGISIQAIDEAHIQTFTQELQSQDGKDLVKAIRSVPESAFVLPFIVSPINLLKNQVRATPMLSAASSHMQKEIAAGGARKEVAEAQLALGSMLLTAGLVMAVSGKVRGDYSVFKTKRQEAQSVGVEPGSYVDSEGNAYTINRYAPVSDFVMLAANSLEQINAFVRAKGNELDDDELMEGVAQIFIIPALAMGQAVVNKPYLMGVANIMNSLNDAVSGDEKASDTAGVALQRVLASAMPLSGQLKHLNQQVLETDPYIREAFDAQAMMARNIPYLSNELAPQVDAYGDPKDVLQAILGGIIPMTKRVPPDHPVKKEVARLKEAAPEMEVLGSIPSTLDGEKLDEQEKYNLMQFMANFKDGNEDDLIQALERVMKSDEYNHPKATDNLRRELLTSVYNSRKEVAKILLQADTIKAASGEDRPWAAELGLYDYSRSKPIAEVVARKKATEARNLFGDLLEEDKQALIKQRLESIGSSVDFTDLLRK